RERGLRSIGKAKVGHIAYLRSDWRGRLTQCIGTVVLAGWSTRREGVPPAHRSKSLGRAHNKKGPELFRIRGHIFQILLIIVLFGLYSASIRQLLCPPP